MLRRPLGAHVVHEEIRIGGHHVERVSLGDRSVEHAHRRDDAAELVEIGVDDQRPQGSILIALGRRDEEDDALEQVVDALAGLSRDAHGVLCGDRERLLDLRADALGLCRGQVDLVDRGNDVEVGVHGEQGIRDGLRLDALGRIDDEHGAFAGGERARHLVREVHVSRGVDEVELVGLTIVGVIGDADGVALDRDAAFALDVHGVEHLGIEVALLHGMGELEHAIRDGRFAVVDVRDDREVADMGGCCRVHAHHSSVSFG